MTKLLFSAEDFEHLMMYFDGGMCTDIDFRNCREIADIANSRLAELKKEWLEELLRDAPVVYGGHQEGFSMFNLSKGPFDTHTARIVCIEEIGGKT